MMTIAKRLDKHFAVCAAAGAAIVGAAQQSDAAVVFSGPVNINIPSTTAGVYLNVVTGVNGITPASSPGWDLNPWSSTTLNIWTNNAAGPGGGTVVAGGATANLPDGSVIGAGSTWGTTTQAGFAPANFNSSNNFFGFRFFHEGTGQIHYGWVQLSLSGTLSAQPRAIVQYAYEDQAGVSITIPGPGALALIGLAGLTGRGRRRR